MMKKVIRYLPFFFTLHRKLTSFAFAISGALSIFANGKLQLKRIAHQNLPVDAIHLTGAAKSHTHTIMKLSRLIEASILGKGAQLPLLFMWGLFFLGILACIVAICFVRDEKKRVQRLIMRSEQMKRNDFMRSEQWK